MGNSPRGPSNPRVALPLAIPSLNVFRLLRILNNAARAGTILG